MPAEDRLGAPANAAGDRVHLSTLVAGEGGRSRFEDRSIEYAESSGPLRVTRTAPAVSIGFRWLPPDFTLDWHPASRRGLVLVTGGVLEVTAATGDARLFRTGDVLEYQDVSGTGHSGRAVGGKPVRMAFVALEPGDGDREPMREAPPAAAGAGIDYLHNREDIDGRSFCSPAHLPYAYGDADGVATPDIPLSGYRFSFAADDFDYGWHPAPTRQIVLVLHGGIAMEYGSGQSSQVTAGDFLIGDDTRGKGHISRAVGNTARFSLFAHLA